MCCYGGQSGCCGHRVSPAFSHRPQPGWLLDSARWKIPNNRFTMLMCVDALTDSESLVYQSLVRYQPTNTATASIFRAFCVLCMIFITTHGFTMKHLTPYFPQSQLGSQTHTHAPIRRGNIQGLLLIMIKVQ